MTIRPFGKPLRVQINLLQLVGYEFYAREMRPAKGGNARKRAMREGLHGLRRATGVDFGYYPSAWRSYLIEHGEETGYTHPYGFVKVDAAVVEAIADADVLTALAELSQ